MMPPTPTPTAQTPLHLRRRAAGTALAAACLAAALGVLATPAALVPTAMAQPAGEAEPAAAGDADAGPGAGAATFDQFRRVQAQFHEGGTVMYILLFLSVLGVTVTLERLFRLRRGAIAPRGLGARAAALWKGGRHEELARLCEQDGSSLARIIELLQRHRDAPVSDLTAAVADLGARELRPHFRRTYPLAVVATIAPLLGLFGTVIGMIEAFDQFRAYGETGNPVLFAGAISKALVTTAFGLAIAVPALAFYHLFRSQVNKYGDLLEAEASELLNECIIFEHEAGGRADAGSTPPPESATGQSRTAADPSTLPPRGPAGGGGRLGPPPAESPDADRT